MAADELGPFGHAVQPEPVPVARAVGVEAGAVVRDLEQDQVRVAAEHDAGRGGALNT